MSEISGRCLCGAVTFEGAVASERVVNCHCEDCRKATGAVHATLLFVPEETVTISGALTAFEHTSDSGSTMTKMFCPTCGSQMFSKNTNRPGVVAIRAGVIAEDDVVKPMFNVFTDSMYESTPLDPDLPSFARMPV